MFKIFWLREQKVHSRLDTIRHVHHWQESIQKDYPAATEMLLLMDGGGSHSCLHYIVKEDLQKLADKLKIKLTVAHDPAYGSKYNKIEQQLFPHLQRIGEGVVFENYELGQSASRENHDRQRLAGRGVDQWKGVSERTPI